MAIRTQSPAKPASILNTPAARKVASKAPDYKPGVMRGDKRQISLLIQPELLERIDALTATTERSRAYLINRAVRHCLEAGILEREGEK